MRDIRTVSIAFQVEQSRKIKKLEAENSRFRSVLQILVKAEEADDFIEAKTAARSALLKSKPS